MNRCFGLTISGPFIRLWTVDAASFASSRVYSFDEKLHAPEIVEIIAFVTQPGVSQAPMSAVWQPTSPLPIRSQDVTVYQEICRTKLLEVRPWLFGSRTTVWSTEPVSPARVPPEDAIERPTGVKMIETPHRSTGGSSMSATSPEKVERPRFTAAEKGKRKASEADLVEEARARPYPPIASLSHSVSKVAPRDRVIFKGSWLSRELKRHEETVLIRLHGSDRPGSDDLDQDGLIAGEHVDPHVIGSLPRVLGLVCDLDGSPDEWQTRPHNLAQDQAPAEETRLHFSVLAVACPLGMRLPVQAREHRLPEKSLGEGLPAAANDGLGLRHFAQILHGCVQSLWYASSKGLHYRDFNQGNVMWRFLSPPSEECQVAVGYLVDFGNARVLNQPRSVLQTQRNFLPNALHLCIDDGRSANPLYQSISSMKAEKLRLSAQELIVTGETVGAQPRSRAYQEQAREAMQELEVEAKKLYHRYLDDVESALYLFSHVVCRA